MSRARKSKKKHVSPRKRSLPVAKRNTPQPAGSQTTAVSIQEAFSGPLPPPNMLAQFEQIEPGFANRIVAMAENQSQHRIQVEGADASAERFTRRFGLVSALITVLAMCSVAAFTVYLGHPKWAAGMMGTTMVALVWAFLKRPKPE